MDHLELPDQDTWERRRKWFEQQFDVDAKDWGGYVINEQAYGLLVDLQSVFCVGAWSSVIILSFAVIEAFQIEETGQVGSKIPAKILLGGLSGEYQWLRKKRNRLLHFSGRVELSIEDHWSERRRRLDEKNARRAVRLTAGLLFSYPLV